MYDCHFKSQAANRVGTLNGLKEQMHSLNMRMLLAIQNHDKDTQEDIQQQMKALQMEIDQMCLGGGSRH